MSATSSPKTRTRSSAAITSCSVRLIASPNVSDSPAAPASSPATSALVLHELRERHDVVGHRARIRLRRGERLPGRVRDERLGLRPSTSSISSVVSTPRSRSAAPIVSSGSRAASSASSSGGAVLALRVGGGVRVRPRDAGVDQRGAHTGAHTRDHLRGEGAHRVVVAAVDRVHLEAAEPPHQLVDRRRRLVDGRHRDRVAVVGDDEQHREVQRARRVEALPEVALRGRALPERHVGQLVAVGGRAREMRPARQVPRRLGASDRGEALAAGRARLRDDVAVGVPPVRGHLPTPRRRVGGAAHRLEQDRGRRDAEPEHERLVPVVREEPVVRRPQLPGQPEEQRLVTGARDLEEHARLLLQRDLAVVDGPRDAGQPEVLDRLARASTRASLTRAPRSSPGSRGARPRAAGTPTRTRRRTRDGRTTSRGCRSDAPRCPGRRRRAPRPAGA